MPNNALGIGWAIALAGFAAMAAWLLAHPASIPSDDAYFFVRGTERFSVLEFRPHFPGYPGFIALAKLLQLTGLEPPEAVFTLSVLSALALPGLAALAASANGASPLAVLLAFAATLTQPFLPLVGLAMMSDATGIAFLLAAMAMFGHARIGSGGAMAGMALACRPSFVVPVLLLVLAVWCLRKAARIRLSIGFFGILIVFFTGVLLLEGTSYFSEGLRFVQGHFQSWGNTAMSDSPQREGWAQVALREPVAMFALLGLIAAGVIALIAPHRQLMLGLAACGAVLWTLVAQNPENLRHMMLPAILLIVWLASLPRHWTKAGLGALILVQSFTTAPILARDPSIAPLEKVEHFLSHTPEATVVTNRGVAYLRAHLTGQRILDAFYAQNARYVRSRNADGPLWIVTASEPGKTPFGIEQIINARVPGEKIYWLYRLR